jgi:hypothetical protein
LFEPQATAAAVVHEKSITPTAFDRSVVLIAFTSNVDVSGPQPGSAIGHERSRREPPQA